MPARNFKELHDKLPAEVRAESEEWVKQAIANMPLDELRAARELTQQQLAQALNINQAAVSKLEHRTDMYVTTLARFIEAMGGQLEIRAVFPDGAVRITQFSEKREAA